MIEAILQAIFGSLWGRFFPSRTASDQKADDLQVDVTALKAEANAAANAPTDKQSLIDALNSHKVCLALLIFPLLTGCANSISSACPTLRPFTNAQEDTLAANIATLPPDSPLIAMALDWSAMRAEIKACSNGG